MESDGFNDRVDIPLGSNLCMQKSKDQVCKYDVLFKRLRYTLFLF